MQVPDTVITYTPEGNILSNSIVASVPLNENLVQVLNSRNDRIDVLSRFAGSVIGCFGCPLYQYRLVEPTATLTNQALLVECNPVTDITQIAPDLILNGLSHNPDGMRPFVMQSEQTGGGAIGVCKGYPVADVKSTITQIDASKVERIKKLLSHRSNK